LGVLIIQITLVMELLIAVEKATDHKMANQTILIEIIHQLCMIIFNPLMFLDKANSLD
jgi:hypothetical protein